MQLVLHPALSVIISLALRRYTATVMLQTFITAPGVSATGGQLPAASYKLSELSTVSGFDSHASILWSVTKVLLLSFVRPVHPELQRRLLYICFCSTVCGPFALWINFLRQPPISGASCVLQWNTLNPRLWLEVTKRWCRVTYSHRTTLKQHCVGTGSMCDFSATPCRKHKFKVSVTLPSHVTSDEQTS